MKPLIRKNTHTTNKGMEMFKITLFRILFLCGLLISGFASATPLPTDLSWNSNNSAPIWSNPNAEKGGVFSDYLLTFPPSLRTVGPDSNSSFRSYINANQLGLVNIHPETSEIIPQIATEWAYDKDGRTVYYKLDPDARWSDGELVTADDFLFTLEFMRSKHIQAPWYNNHYSEQIKSVKKYDSYTISITGAIARPKEDLHYYYGLTPTPQHFYKEISKDWVKKYNWVTVPNTGPYQISKIKKGKQIDFLRKQDWWAKDKRYNVGRFNVNKVTLKVIRDANLAYKHFEKGNLDSFDLAQPEFWHNKAKGKLFDNGYIEKFVFYNDKPRPSSGIYLNTSNKLLKDKNVRLALAHSLNFKRVMDTVLRGDYERLQSQFVGYGEYTNNDIKARTYNLEKANAILDESGWNKRDGDGIRLKNDTRLSLTLNYAQKSHNDRWSILKQDAIKAGIEIKLNLQDPSAQYKAIMQKQHQMVAMGWGAQHRPQFWGQYHSVNAHKPDTNNISNIDNPEMDEVIGLYRKETHKNKRIELARNIESMIYDSASFIPSFNVPYTRGAHWRWLKLPEVPGSKTTGSLYSPFGDGGLFWIDGKQKVETKSARKSSTKYPLVNKVFDRYKANI